jgi:hypothetical protein
MAGLDEKLIRSLKLVVVSGAVLIAAVSGLLVWLLLQRQRTAAEVLPSTLALPADARIGQMVGAGNQLAILGEAADGRRFLATIDLTTGRRRHLLWLVPEPP